jgi:DNA-binding transcriptional MerR regulator
MLRIGDFARVGQVSVKTLHHYSDIGLLQPASVDPWTGYRYYTLDQLPRLHRILALKDLGFALDEIASLLDQPQASDAIRPLLNRKQLELRRRVQEEQERLARVEARLRLIGQEGCMEQYDVVVKPLAAQAVVSLRDAAVPVAQIAEQAQRLRGEMDALLILAKLRPTGPWVLVLHDEGRIERVIDLELAAPVPAGSVLTAGGAGRAVIAELPAVEQAAATVHQGAVQSIDQAYDALWQWVIVNGYRKVGSYRAVTLREDIDNTVTEIQVPVTHDLRLDRLSQLLPEIPYDTLLTASERLRQALQNALDVARDFGQRELRPEHLLLGLIRAPESMAAHVIQRAGSSPAALHSAVEGLSGFGSEPVGEPQIGDQARSILLAAVDERKRLGHDYFGTEHILLALLQDTQGLAVQALAQSGVSAAQVQKEVRKLLHT